MITKISMNNVASYKSHTSLVTSKPVNLIYGLNGSGKTTITKFLKNLTGEEFSDCSIVPNETNNLLFRVYNQSFIEEVFFNQDTQKGIFTLSKQNKDAEKKIADAKSRQLIIQGKAENIQEDIDKNNEKIDDLTNNTRNTCFKIKQEYTGGDRILDEAEFLKGLKQKTLLLNHLLTIDKVELNKDVTDIKKEVELLNKTNSEGVLKLPLINISTELNLVETSFIFMDVIIGKSDNTISSLIDHLGNSDWFTKGLIYLDNSNEKCPFCQQKIEQTLKNELLDYLDETYKLKLEELTSIEDEYNEAVLKLPEWDEYKDSDFIVNIDKFKNNFDHLRSVFKDNLKLIKIKYDKPSQVVELSHSNSSIKELNAEIEEANKKIDTHNDKVKNKQKSLNTLKNEFWQIQRNDYDTAINAYNQNLKKLKKAKISLDLQLKRKRQEYKDQNLIIQEQQKQTVNIDETIDNINNLLIDCGLVGFKIVKHEDHFYRIVREDDETQEKVFTSLSEGEKTMISFFYFLELCRGNADPNETQNKIIVIDDPISSLSHMYVFNIAQLIKKEFTKTKIVKGVNGEPDRIKLANKDSCVQCFIFTHSLYFFYDMTDANHERRKETQCLYRIAKGINGSEIMEMSYNEIQNDYQSYWSTVKDDNTPPALLANSMRNIIEYFFNFIEKTDLNNTFNNGKLDNIKYQSFNRYINRESHSLGQNIFDYKEFDYDIFREAFKLVFEENGYSEHYNKMIKK